PVDLLGDFLLGEGLHHCFAVSAVLRQGHPANRESTEDNRQQAASHDFSSDRTKVCSPLGNKDVGLGRFVTGPTRNPKRPRRFRIRPMKSRPRVALLVARNPVPPARHVGGQARLSSSAAASTKSGVVKPSVYVP